jgi:hypothetical protein
LIVDAATEYGDDNAHQSWRRASIVDEGMLVLGYSRKWPVPDHGEFINHAAIGV